jgi:hypothetical protein
MEKDFETRFGVKLSGDKTEEEIRSLMCDFDQLYDAVGVGRTW